MSEPPSWPPLGPWARAGLCVGRDPDIFYDQDRQWEAVAICRDCPVQEPCLEWAVQNRMYYGVWGGTIVADRFKARWSTDRARQLRARRYAELRRREERST